MASSSVYKKKYDVFISFRGSDVRQGFLSHLHKALLNEKIEAFVDEQLNRGEEISESLLEKIEESYVAIVIFSQNYAYSEWCLEELLKIAECRNKARQTVIPVFYGVDPSYVQDLTGSYGDAMAQHRTQFDELLVEKWSSGLKDTASLSGLVSSNFKTESNLIEEIINHTLEKLNCLYPSDSDCDGGLVGINSRVEKVMSLLCGSEDVCIVGIWGEGGIGKTTLARVTFDRICSQFDTRCFVGNVREKSEKFTADAIQNEVVLNLFGTSDSSMTRKRLSRKKVILVLDDVSDLDQMKSIMRYRVDVGSGSRIIVTSRDLHLLKNLGAKIYVAEKLCRHEALQLFCLNAFNKKVPDQGYAELSKRAVIYAEGLPLALEVLGCNLFQRSAEEWEDELEKLKGMLDPKILKILRISYDGLSDVEKEILLDIACCFKGRIRDEVESLLDVPGSKIGINRLAEKALISISSGDCINIHDLIQQMAKDVICEGKTLGERRWLWDPEEIYFLFTREMGTEAVRGISLDMSKIKNINLSPTAFWKMFNLRYLHFYNSGHDNARLWVPQGLEYLPEQLRYLYWDQYPSKSLPSNSLCAEKLVELGIHDSQLEELWNGVQNLPNLKRFGLNQCTKLIKLPDLSTASNLKSLSLYACESLVEIPSMKYSSKLTEVILAGCLKIESLPDDICDLKCLSYLEVSHCYNLHVLPQNIGNLKSLGSFWARQSSIKELPESFCNLQACIRFNMSNSRILRPWPKNINLTNYSLSEFPVALCSVTALRYLTLAGNYFESIPESIQQLVNLKDLSLYGCKKLKCLPESIKLLPLLSYLNLKECTSMDQNQCSEIANHLIMARIEGRRRPKAVKLWYPGSELPEKMKYKNECSSSLSFSFKLLRRMGYSIPFQACLVLDRPTSMVTFKGIFTDESGLSLILEGRLNLSHTSTLKLVILEPIHFQNANALKGCELTAEIQFQSYLIKGKDDEDRPCRIPTDSITKCGLFPLVYHETLNK